MADDPKLLPNDFIPLDIEAVIGKKYNNKIFNSGVNDVSYYAGIIVGILNTGISERYIPDIFRSILNDLDSDGDGNGC